MLLIVAIFALALPIFAAANSSAIQSIFPQAQEPSVSVQITDDQIVSATSAPAMRPDHISTLPDYASTLISPADGNISIAPLHTFETPFVKDWTNLDFINPSFEYPYIGPGGSPDGVSPGETPPFGSGQDWRWSNAQAQSTRWNMMHEDFVPGWRTLPTDPVFLGTPQGSLIEFFMAGSPHGATPHGGNQAAELAAEVDGTLFQDVVTTPGQHVYWEFHHRARGTQAIHIDRMDFFLYAVPNTSSNLIPQDNEVYDFLQGDYLDPIQIAESDALAWYRSAGMYTVPTDQTLTRFAFQAVSNTVGGVAGGNLLDDIRLFTPSFLEVRKQHNASGTTYALRGERLTYTIEVENIGEADASRSVLTDTLPKGVDFVAGSITINGSPAGALGTYDSATRTLRVNLGTGATPGNLATNGGIIDHGQTVTVTFQVDVVAKASTLVKNQARVTYDDHTFENLTDGGFWNVSPVSEFDVKELIVTNVTPKGVGVPITETHLEVTFSHSVDITSLGTITINGITLDLSTGIWSSYLGDINRQVTIPFPFSLELATRYDTYIEGFRPYATNRTFSLTNPLYIHHFATKGYIAIVKELLMPEGTTTPNVTFEFVIEPHSLNADTIPEALSYLPPLYDNNSQSVSFSPLDTTSANATNTIVIERFTSSLLTDVVFPFAGVFSYQIKEVGAGSIQTTDTGTLYFDTQSFIISFDVEKLPGPNTGYFVSSYIVQRLNLDGSLGDKTDSVVFRNTFTRQEDLQVSKELRGPLANLTRYFSFEITVTAPYLIQNPNPPMTAHSGFVAYVQDLTTGANVTSASNSDNLQGTTPNYYLLFTSGVKQEVRLKHNQVLVFTDTHVGTRYSVTEVGTPNYQAHVIVTTAGNTSLTTTATTGQDLTITNQLVGEGENQAAFVNTSRVSPPTGILQGSFVPVLGVGVIAGLATVGSVTYRRRKQGELKELEVLVQS